jgi:ribosome-binding protein aMBF1 (putative translation factor)
VDVLAVIDSHGLPIAGMIILGIGVTKLISYILFAQDKKLEGYNAQIVEEFEELESELKKDYSRIESIIIKLIDQQKLMQLDLAEQESNVKTLVEFLQTERDLEKDRLLSKLEKVYGIKL